jgi:tetratricopeptide (TPR) repeat protein
MAMPGKVFLTCLTLIVIARLAPAVLCANHAATRQENVLETGIKLLSDGRFAEAVEAFNRFKQTSALDARPYFYAGMAYTEMARLNAAALELEEAVRLDPRKPQYLIFQANVYSRLKQNDHALDVLAALGTELASPQVETAWLWLVSDTYFRLEQYDEVLKIQGILRGRSPQEARVDLTIGRAYVAKGSFDQALESFKKCIETGPENAAAYYEIGNLYHQRNEQEAARTALREAVRLDPRQPGYFLKLGQVCLTLGQLDESIGYLTKVERLDPELAQAYYALGSAYHRKGDPARSAEYRRKFQELSSKQRKKQEFEEEVSRLIAQGEKQLDQGKEAAARELFESAVKLDPENWDARGYLVEMILLTPEWRRAYPHLVKMEESDSSSPVGNYLMARYWYLGKEYEKALAYAEKVKLVRPAHADLRNLIGGIYAALGKTDKAALEFEAAVRLAPDRADFLENLRKVKDRKQP